MILLTGANGFIGSALASYLQSALPNSPLVASDHIGLQERPNLLAKKNLHSFVPASEVMQWLQAHVKSNAPSPIRWVIHLGAISATTERNWTLLEANNLRYSQNLFEWCAIHQVPLIYASSAATYGNGERGYDDQMDCEKLQPLNLYGKSKLLMDAWAIQQSQMPPRWYGLRYFNVFGPNEYFKGEMASLVYKAFHQINKTGKMRLFRSYRPDFGHGEQMRDFIYVKQVCEWTLELMNSQAPSGVYNMGSGKARSWLDLANAVFAALDQPTNIEFIEMPSDIRDQYQYFTEASMKKWVGAGLSAAKWNLESSVHDYVNHYLKKNELVL